MGFEIRGRRNFAGESATPVARAAIHFPLCIRGLCATPRQCARPLPGLDVKLDVLPDEAPEEGY